MSLGLPNNSTKQIVLKIKNLSNKQRNIINVKNKTEGLFPLLRIMFYDREQF